MGMRERIAKLEDAVRGPQEMNDKRTRLRALALESEANLYTLEATPGTATAPAAQSGPTLHAPKPS